MTTPNGGFIAQQASRVEAQGRRLLHVAQVGRVIEVDRVRHRASVRILEGSSDAYVVTVQIPEPASTTISVDGALGSVSVPVTQDVLMDDVIVCMATGDTFDQQWVYVQTLKAAV